MKPATIISIIIGGIVGFFVMRFLGFGSGITAWIFIFVGAAVAGWIAQLVVGKEEQKDTDKK